MPACTGLRVDLSVDVIKEIRCLCQRFVCYYLSRIEQLFLIAEWRVYFGQFGFHVVTKPGVRTTFLCDSRMCVCDHFEI